MMHSGPVLSRRLDEGGPLNVKGPGDPDRMHRHLRETLPRKQDQRMCLDLTAYE